MSFTYAPGCALILHDQQSTLAMYKLVQKALGQTDYSELCCFYKPNLLKGTEIINTCPGCDQRLKQLYEEFTTQTVWEILAAADHLELPVYDGMTLSIHDACPTRERREVHEAVRKLAHKMKIKLIEPEHSGSSSICCGDSYYGVLSIDQVKQAMQNRADQMPNDEVLVYCVSCVKAISIGGKKPRLLSDLLLGQETVPGVLDLDEWHKQLKEYRLEHFGPR